MILAEQYDTTSNKIFSSKEFSIFNTARKTEDDIK